MRRAAAGRPYENAVEHVGRGGLWPPAQSGMAFSLCHSERSEESVSPVFVRDRDTPSVTFGDSSLREGAKDESYGFDRLAASE